MYWLTQYLTFYSTFDKTAQKLINVYPFAGFFKKNDQQIAQITPITYNEKAKYSERIFEELERKWGKLISSASVDYINGVIGIEKEFAKISELVSTIVNSTSYPFIPAKYLRESIKDLVKAGEIAILRGEVCEPDEVDIEKGERILKNLKINVETDVRDSDFVLKKEFANELLDAAKRKIADVVAGKIVESLGDKNYAEISYIESALPEYSRKDILDAAKRSNRLELYAGDVELIRMIEEDVKLDEGEVRLVLDSFGGKGAEYIFKKDYADEIKKKLKIELPPEIVEKEEEVEVTVTLSNLIENFDDFAGKKVHAVKISGKGSDNLKEDSMSISGAVSFLNLSGKIRVNVTGSVRFDCITNTEKAGTVDEILRRISELDDNPSYTIEILEVNVEINDDFRIFAVELANTRSEKTFRVR